MLTICPDYVKEIYLPRNNVQNDELEQYLRTENVCLIQCKKADAKKSSNVIRKHMLAALQYNEIYAIKNKAKFLKLSQIVKEKYINAIKDYDEAVKNGFEPKINAKGSVSKLYEKKYSDDGTLLKVAIREYKNDFLKKESDIFEDNGQKVHITERTDKGYDEYIFFDGKLSEFKINSFKNGKKVVEELYSFDIRNSALREYYKNIVKNDKGEFVAKKSFQFDESEKLINAEKNVVI